MMDVCTCLGNSLVLYPPRMRESGPGKGLSHVPDAGDNRRDFRPLLDSPHADLCFPRNHERYYNVPD